MLRMRFGESKLQSVIGSGAAELHPSRCIASFSSDRGRTALKCRPSAWVSSLGITQTLFASPWAIWGSTWRYW